MTKIFAHRGSKGTHPENTLAAFAESVRIGVDGIELDIHLSKDEELVVIHDETLNRTTSGKGEVADFTLAELKQFDAGSWFACHYEQERIPTLLEVFDLLQQLAYQGIVNVEVKTDEKEYPGIEEKLVALVHQRTWSFDVMYSSFNLLTLQRLAMIDMDTKKSWIMVGSVVTLPFAHYFSMLEGIHPNFSWFIESEQELQQFDKAVRPWTVNSEYEMWMCFERNVTAFHTDYPEQALKLRKKFEQETMLQV